MSSTDEREHYLLMDTLTNISLRYQTQHVALTSRTIDLLARQYEWSCGKIIADLSAISETITQNTVKTYVDRSGHQSLLRPSERKELRRVMYLSQILQADDELILRGSVIELSTNVLSSSDSKTIKVDNRTTTNEIVRLLGWYLLGLEKICLSATFDPRLLNLKNTFYAAQRLGEKK